MARSERARRGFNVFWLTKLLEMVFSLSNLLILLVAGGTALLWTRHREAGKRLLTGVAAVFVVLMLFPVDEWLAAPLESGFPPPPHPKHVDGILVLSGHFSNLVAAAQLARDYPKAKLVFTGGAAHFQAPQDKDSDYAASLFASLGIDPKRVVLEDKARDTWENLVFSQRLVKPKPGETWLLVTTALHMSRAWGISRKIGWRTIPWPSEYISSGPGRTSLWTVSFAQKAYALEMIRHEYFGLIAYRIAGKTDALFP